MRRVSLFLPVMTVVFSGVPFLSTAVALPPRPPVATTTTIAMTTPQAYAGTTAVETVTVTDSVNSYPDGTVNCSASQTSQTFSGTLSNGSVSWPLSNLPSGAYDLTCSYAGNTAFLPSTSQTVTQQIVGTPQPVWNQGGNMSTPRSGHTATLLGNGSILLAGGINNTPFCSYANRTCFPFSTQNTAEIYNPTTLSTSGTANTMQNARQGATATLLSGGQVLIVGGGLQAFAGSIPLFRYTTTADIYDPSSNQFTAAGNMSYARCGASAITLHSGKILIVGGAAGAPAELYDPSTGSFSTTGTPVTSRASGSTATLLQNGNVLITGGTSNLGCYYNVDQVNSQDILSSAEIYDTGSGQFTATAGPMNASRTGHTATLLSTGQVLITGGTSDLQNGLSSAELYDPVANTFTYTGSLNTGRANHTANVLANGLILIAGGVNPVGGTGGARTVLSSAELYNPSTQAFTTTVPMNVARDFPVSVVLPTGAVVETGGSGAGSPPILSSIETYAPPTVSGWVNPKYIIVGVTYAPPGASSTATYANSVTQGNTTTISDSFSNDIGLAVSIQNGITVGQTLVANGTIQYTASSSTDYTQGNMSSQAVTLMKQATFSQSTHGVLDSANPVDHDYDVIWLWLNPLALFTVDPSEPQALVWNGYGFDPNDIPTQDIYPVFAGKLNGDLPMDQSTADVLARSWAKNQNWPPGEGPALTQTDYATIVQADPFVSCIYNNATQSYSSCYFPQNDTAGNNFGPPLPINSADGRFSLVPTNQSIPYTQGGPSTSYSESTTNTTVNTQQTNHSFKQAFGLDVNFTLSTSALGFFASTLKIDTKYSQTLNWTHSFQQAFTETTMNTSSMMISPISCVNGNCSTYAGPGEFLVYQDNLYGTFMFYPVY